MAETEQTHPPKADALAVSIPPLAVSIEQAAELLGISRAQYYRCVKAGEVPAPVALGRRRVVPFEALRACLAA